MDSLRGVLEYIRNYFNPPAFLLDGNRKRRATNSMDIHSPKCRRLLSSPKQDIIDLDSENYYSSPKPFPIYRSTKPREVETIVLDDDNIERKKFSKKLNGNYGTLSQKTSTPNVNHLNVNGLEDEEVMFVKEIKSPKLGRKTESVPRRTLLYRPFSMLTKDKSTNMSNLNSKINGTTKSTLNTSNSVRLDDKMTYKMLLESSNNSSIYSTPVGKLFSYDTANKITPNRTSKIMSAALKSPTSSVTGRLSTKDTITKILGDFENDPVVVKDSDSDSDVILVTPPSPKPDIKVNPVNSLKKIVDTTRQANPEWLDKFIHHHKTLTAERKKEIKLIEECSEKHGKINKDMQYELLADKINKSLKIKEAILPVIEIEEEAELPPITAEQIIKVKKAFKGDPNEVLSSKFNLNITRRDILTLSGLHWLNDEVINFYMNMIIERGKDKKWPKSYAFNTFFYMKLIRDGPQSLRRWTKKVDLFTYDLVCVPIHLGMHWCMAIIDFRDKSIRYYDSMGNSNNKCLDALRRYLEAEHQDKKKSSYDTSAFQLENVKDIPQQMNGSDCGMFACTFAEFLTRNAKITFTQENMPYLRQKMVIEILEGELLIH